MEKYSFFDSIGDDRVSDSSDFARYFSKFFTNGIFNNTLAVRADEGMNIIIESGDANINGYRYTNTNDLQKQIDIADSNQSRIDNVVLRWDLENRQITIEIVKGEYADNPIAPALVRTSRIYDLRLAEINVKAAISEITDQLIKDCRFDTNDCGNVTQAVLELDTTELFRQYEAAFYDWFVKIKDELSTDAAGNLQNQINTINTNIKSNDDGEWEVIELSNNELENWLFEE